MKDMSINIALNHMKSATDPFLIKVVRGTGKKVGTIKTISKALYGVANAHVGRSRQDPSAGVASKWKKSGIIPVIDQLTNTKNTIKIAHIIRFNNYRVIH